MRILQRISLALAWTVVGLAFLLLVAEESGLLADLVRTQLARHLGPLGSGLSIERVSLRWFQPGIELEDLRLYAPEQGPTAPGRESPAPPAGADAAPGGNQELLRLRRASLSLALDGFRPVTRFLVDGGRVLFSDRLLGGLDAARERDRQRSPGTQEREPPPIAIHDLDVDLELPDGTLFELGRTSIVASPDEDGRYRLRGSLTPVLAGLVSRPVEIQVDGRQSASGLVLRTAARELPLQSRSFRRPAALEGLPLEELSGELSLEASARLDWSGERLHIDGDLRTRLAEGRLLPRVGDPLLEALRVALDVDFDLEGGRPLWDRELWSASLHMQADWLGSPVTAWGRFGRDLAADTWAHAWARWDSLPLEESLLERLGADPRRMALWRSLAPRGVAATTVDLRLAPPRLEQDVLRWSPPQVAAALELDGRVGLTYVGVPDPEGRPRGFPIPVDGLTGEVFFAVDPSHGDFARVDIDAEGNHGSGRLRAAGVTGSAAHPGEPWSLDLELRTDSIAVDQTLIEGLAGHYSTAFVWPEYRPWGGTLALAWRLFEDGTTHGMTASGEVELRDVGFAWRELPIPFEHTGGQLSFRWARRPAWRAADLSDTVRPFGMSYRADNRAAEGSGKIARASVTGFVRDGFQSIPDRSAVPPTKTQGISIELDELFLRGRDWETITKRFPSIAAPIEELGAKGGVRVHFEGSRSAPEAPYRTTIEVHPTETTLTPSSFRRTTQDLRGWVVVSTEQLDAGDESVEVTLALHTSWPSTPDDVELACQGELFVGLPSRIVVHGAGLDPSNPRFRGALLRALSGDERGASGELDVSQSALAGRIDFTMQSELVPSSEIQAKNLYRIFLRDNELSNGSLRLEGLRGVLVQSGEILASPQLQAALAGHPLELRDVNVFRLGDAARLALADPILQRPTFWSDPDGYALQADVYVTGLPLDEPHLSSLLSGDTLTAFRDSPDWRGLLDVEGAQIVVTTERGGQGKVAVRGDVVPRDLFLRFGVPIEVPRAQVSIEEVIFEGGRVRGWGRVRDLDASFFDRRLSGARMLFSYVDGRMSIDNLAGAFSGGRLESLGGEGQGTRKALAFDLAPPYHFDLALRLEQVQVPELLGGIFQSSIADAGVIDGGLRLRGTPRDVLGITGGGWLNLDEGRLWSIPVMRALFQQLGSDDTFVFDRLRSHFEVENGRIETTDIRIQSTLLRLVGSGVVDFDGTLRYDLEARYGLLDRLGPLNRILYWLNSSLWRVAVRGDMARPRVSIRNALLEFISRFDDTPRRELPLPDFSALPERF